MNRNVRIALENKKDEEKRFQPVQSLTQQKTKSLKPFRDNTQIWNYVWRDVKGAKKESWKYIFKETENLQKI
jgi:ABC-type dipeptide/oligopeptide/nickel transport system ATPase subunit